MSKSNTSKTSSGKLNYPFNKLGDHAERQVGQYTELVAHRESIPEKLWNEMEQTARATLKSKETKDEWFEDQKSSLMAQRQMLDRIMNVWSEPSQVATTIGYADEDGKVRIRKYHVVGDLKWIVCREHKDTIGHGLFVPHSGAYLENACNKCLMKMSDRKNGHHVVRRHLERKGVIKKSSGKRNGQGRSESNLDPAEQARKLLFGNIPKDLSSLSMTELREEARKVGLQNIPRRKVELISALEGL